MSHNLSIAFLVPSLQSDWNNGNAHFLRGLIRAMASSQQHDVLAVEPAENWSRENLLLEGSSGTESLAQFRSTYPDIPLQTYTPDTSGRETLRRALTGRDIVIVHEWNTPELIDLVLSLRDELHFRALFHDTHHRASSSPEQIKLLQVQRFDGVLAFGEALRQIYLHNFGLSRVWTFHEAADSSVFHPRPSHDQVTTQDVVWIGNWGEGERSAELHQFLIHPAARLSHRSFTIYGVRYPQQGLEALASAGIHYGGYLPNLEAPAVYAQSHLTLHVPRQQYTSAMTGIPTIRVFEALASGIPLISAPWPDTENLFNPGDFLYVSTEDEMTQAIELLLSNPADAKIQACRGLQTILRRHTCEHRAEQLTDICREVLSQ